MRRKELFRRVAGLSGRGPVDRDLAFVIVQLSREQAAENPLADLEASATVAPAPSAVGFAVPPRPQVFFRPEEVDRRSERVDGLASPRRRASPNHTIMPSASGPAPPGVAANISGSPQWWQDDATHGLADHRRQAERVDRAAGVALAAVARAHVERALARRRRDRRGRSGPRGPDQILIVECDEGLADVVRPAPGEVATMSSTGIGPPRSRKVCRMSWSKGLLASRPSSRLPLERNPAAFKLLGRQDPRSPWSASFPAWDEGKVCSNSRLKGYLGRAGAWRRRVGLPSGRCRSTPAQYRDDPLLRAGGVTARSRPEFGRLSAVRQRSPQAAELHPAGPGPGVLLGEVRTLLRLADERKRPCAEVASSRTHTQGRASQDQRTSGGWSGC